MLCDYAILIVSSNLFNIVYQSKFKYDAVEFFIEFVLQEQNIDLNKMLSVINKRGYILFYEDGTLYIMCKYWIFSCYECDRIGLTYRVRYSSRLCQECTHKYLKEVLRNPSRKGVSSKKEFIELMKAV